MKLSTMALTMVRRWYLTLGGLLLTAALCYGVVLYVPPSYQATANVVLLPPKTSVLNGGNPYLQLSGLTQVVDVLSRALGAEDTVAAIAAIEPSATYTAETDVTTSGPILLVKVDDKTAAGTLAVLGAILDRVPVQLTNLQSGLGIATESQITSREITRDSVPDTVQKTRLRVLVVAVAVGLILTAFGVALLDSLLMRRRARRAERNLADAREVPERHMDDTGAKSPRRDRNGRSDTVDQNSGGSDREGKQARRMGAVNGVVYSPPDMSPPAWADESLTNGHQRAAADRPTRSSVRMRPPG